MTSKELKDAALWTVAALVDLIFQPTTHSTVPLDRHLVAGNSTGH